MYNIKDRGVAPWYGYQQQNLTPKVINRELPVMNTSPSNINVCYHYNMQGLCIPYQYSPVAGTPLAPLYLVSAQPPGLYEQQSTSSSKTVIKEEFDKLRNDNSRQFPDQVPNITMPKIVTSMDSKWANVSIGAKENEPRVTELELGFGDANISYCPFCKKNGETLDKYMSHKLRRAGIRSPIECPVLRAYVCTLCGATGDNAHTKSHCPKSRSKMSILHPLLNSTYNSSGRIRR